MDTPEPVRNSVAPDAANATGGRAYLRVLDQILCRAVDHARIADPAAATDRWRGLHLNADTVASLTRGGGLLAGFRADPARLADAARQDHAMGLLAGLYNLPAFAIAALALALAPETDARYGRIFGFLQDDITRRLPTPALALDLFCHGDLAREHGRLAFTPGAPLSLQNILQIEPAANETALTAPLRLDPQIRQFLLGEPGVDPRLSQCCTLRAGRTAIADLAVEPAVASALQRAADTLRQPAETPLRLMLLGPPGCGQEQAADALADAAGLPVLALDARALAAESANPALLLAIFRREALLANAVVQIAHAEALDGDAHAHLRALLHDALPRIAPAVVLAVTPATWLAAAADRAGFAPLVFDLPSSKLRRNIWRDCAAGQGIALTATELDTLSTRFRLTPRQIAQAATRAAMSLRVRPNEIEGNALSACLAAAPAQGGHDLTRLAKRITPRFGWHDIVTPQRVRTQLQEICERVRLGATVLEHWRFADKLALGRGISALFAGPSGTGKTMAAEVIAAALAIPLFKIDLATVVSKYIGETEQNLDRIFRAAEDVNAILLFDEADALFGKRSEVRDSHDRYANLEISYLLQKMEEFEGVAILSTNLQKNLDDAFTRRLSFIVHFPLPDAADRARIWQVVWPDAVPRDPALRFDAIADTCKLSGGNIKSAALGAAYYAAAEGSAVGIRHVVRAVEREYEKLGRPLKPAEIAPLLAQGSAA